MGLINGLLCASIILCICPHSKAAVLTSTSSKEEFQSFLRRHDKVYTDQEEWERRFANYARAKSYVESFQQQHSASFHVRLNQFSDAHQQELDRMRLDWSTMRDQFQAITAVEEAKILAPQPLPKSIDWASKNNPLHKSVVTPPQNQRHCGACWAFVATPVVESAVAISTGCLTPLSAQQLIDCDTRWNDGCMGGNPIQAYDFIETVGLADAESYPYLAEKKSCPSGLKPVSAIRSYRLLESDNEDALQAAVARQPVAVGIAGQHASFLYYAGGIYDDDKCGTDLNHAIVIVGYGIDAKTGRDYWLAKNFWGEGWGEKGYVRLARHHSGPGVCGLATAPSVPVGAYGGNATGIMTHKIQAQGQEHDGTGNSLGKLLPALLGISLIIGILSGYIVSLKRSRGSDRIHQTHGYGYGYGVDIPWDGRATQGYTCMTTQERSEQLAVPSGDGQETASSTFPAATVVSRYGAIN